MTTYRVLCLDYIWDTEDTGSSISNYEGVEITVDKLQGEICLSRYKEKGRLIFTREEWEELTEFVQQETDAADREISKEIERDAQTNS